MTLCLFCDVGFAQDSSLLHRPAAAPANGMMGPYAPSMVSAGGALDPSYQSLRNTVQAASLIYTPTAPRKVWQKHDIVHIRVDETSQMTAQDNASSRKNASYDAVISDWIKLVGLKAIGPAAQKDGDPRVAGQETEVYRADSTLRERQSMIFNIAAEVADIRPNGTLVISTLQKSIKLNDNQWEFSLEGICRPEDIGPDNVILSRNILQLQIVKNERGHVRDGISRGWFTQLLAKIKPF
jgi:flagellar L-ring protein precursor FlgH